MLFDLRSRGRRRIIKVVYLGLALLLGGGLVLFGIGGEVSGGLVDAFQGGNGNSGDDVFEERVEQAQERVTQNPQDAAAWAALARARVQMAGVGENYDQDTATFTESGRSELQEADRAWQRYLELDPEEPDATVATQMVQAYAQGALDDPVKAAQAQEMAIEAGQAGAGQYASLAVFAYRAGQTRKGDLAADRALELTESRMQREQLRQVFQEAKTGQPAGTATETPAG